MPHEMKSTYQVAIVGGGPVGLLSTLLLAQKGHKPLLIRKRARSQPGRSVALMQPNIELLKNAGVWDRLASSATPLKSIRIIDATQRLLRAPAITFRSSELGLDAFAMNIENDRLVDCLEAAIQDFGCTLVDSDVDTACLIDDHVELKTSDDLYFAHAVIAADGRNSILRNVAGIETKSLHYGQTALTVHLKHEFPHQGISTEFHTRAGPMTFVPMEGNTSSLVLVTTKEDAEKLKNEQDDILAIEIQKRSYHFLGHFNILGERATWPLQNIIPSKFATKRIFLVGEAAHVLPPIGAQGLNLGLRDAFVATNIISGTLKNNEDPGADPALRNYNLMRGSDIRQRSQAIDVLNRSLLSPYLPVHILRGIGFYAAQKSRFLRNILMRAGIGPTQDVFS